MATWKRLLTEVDNANLTAAIATVQATADAAQTASEVSSAITSALADYSTTASIAATYATIADLNAAESDISTLQSNYTTLSGTVSSNTSAIGTNASAIAANASDIDAAEAAIATNTTNIGTNTTAIATINSSLSGYAQLSGATFTGAVTVNDNLTVLGTLDVQTINYNSTNATEILIEDYLVTVGSGATGAATTLDGAGLKVNAAGITGGADYGLFYQSAGTYSKFELGTSGGGDFVGVVRKYTGAPTGDAAVGKFAVNASTGDMYIAVA